jgi:two-component system, chemotaxis family, CheB/CheR fusion protein
MAEANGPNIVGIGASAGGVSALREFFGVMPPDTGAAFVVVMHLDPDARSEMTAILAARTAMPVQEVEDEAELRADCVYVIAPGRQLRIADHHIAALPFDTPRGQRAPIDLFLGSLAAQHSDAFAVILTGAGADGAVGVRAIKEAGGIVLVQDPDEAEYSSMPRNAIATEAADFVLPLQALAERLVDLIGNRNRTVESLREETQNEELRRILSLVRARTGHDFTQYKRGTMLRRILRRVQITGSATLADYSEHLRDHVEEAQALFGDFLISVTTFFRDADAFGTFATRVVPRLFDNKEEGSAIRVWIPGCATGEEAYTVGMLLLEAAAERHLPPQIQIFGSDLDTSALAIAREGLYPAAIKADLGRERLHRFFRREGSHFRVGRELRDVVLFASHSLLKDPPFSRLDLVTCRNLLIYLDRDLQQQVCSTFHYALNPGGFLMLGSSESADLPSGLFRVLDRGARLFQAAQLVGDRRPPLPALLAARPIGDRSPSPAPPVSTARPVNDAAIHRQALEQAAPPSILIDESHRAIHLSETAGRFLKPSAGPVTTDIVDLVREELRFDLRTALHRVFERGEATLSGAIVLPLDGEQRRVYLQVKSVSASDRPSPLALVLFVEGDGLASLDAPSEDDAGSKHVAQLQQELQLTRGTLRTTREEAEATNEELRATNEELQSVNEEYRSTSEELETGKEELQSVNEELQTVNNELKLKLESVSRAHSDLQNLMAAIDFGTLFLDPALQIKRFTPRLTDLFSVTAADEGRPITDFTHDLEYTGMADDARAVLRDLASIEKEVRSNKGCWYLVRMRPYRTIEDKIDGVVVTFVDITERRRTEESLRLSEESLRQKVQLVELSRAPIFVWDFEDGVVQWNQGSEDLYGYSREEAIGQRQDELLRTVVPNSSFADLRQHLIEKRSWAGELIHVTKDGRELTVESQIELVSVGDQNLVMESTRDVTDRKGWEQRQKLLLEELTHRVKNTLSVVQAIAHRTLRGKTSVEEFIEPFEGRLQALAQAHELLVRSHWHGAEFGALVRSQLEPHLSSDPGRLDIAGPPVSLPSKLVTPFGLLLHELATNAAKYGALSSTKGRVTLIWKLDETLAPPLLSVVWTELDGPSVAPPNRKGFGSVLIEHGFPEAKVCHDFFPEGVCCKIELRLTAQPPDLTETDVS